MAGKNYQVELTSDLTAGSYSAVPSVITAAGSAIIFNVQSATTSGFYRVKIVP